MLHTGESEKKTEGREILTYLRGNHCVTQLCQNKNRILRQQRFLGVDSKHHLLKLLPTVPKGEVAYRGSTGSQIQKTGILVEENSCERATPLTFVVSFSTYSRSQSSGGKFLEGLGGKKNFI